jgi:hypothetical protein
MEMVLRVLKSIEFIEANLVTDLAEDELGIQAIARRAVWSPVTQCTRFRSLRRTLCSRLG